MSLLWRVFLPLILALTPSWPSAETTRLPNWEGIELKAFNYKGPFFPSEWGEPKLGGYDWKAENAKIDNGTLNLSVSEKASGQVQSSDYRLSAFWEVDVVLPRLTSGLIAAPLWVMSSDVNADEIDFEFVGEKGLTITAWTKVNGKKISIWSRGSNEPIIAGNLSERHYRLGIAYEAGRSISWYIDGELRVKITPQDTGGVFPNLPLKPFFDMWVANGLDPDWAGRWKPMAESDRLVMQITGYQVRSLK